MPLFLQDALAATEAKLTDPWFLFSIAAQALFMARFWVQWLQSERQGRSVVPNAFWLFSLGGGLLLTIYLMHREEWALFVGQASGLVIYARNLHLIRRNRSAAAQSAAIAEARKLADELHEDLRKLTDMGNRPLRIDENLDRLKLLLQPSESEVA